MFQSAYCTCFDCVAKATPPRSRGLCAGNSASPIGGQREGETLARENKDSLPRRSSADYAVVYFFSFHIICITLRASWGRHYIKGVSYSRLENKTTNHYKKMKKTFVNIQLCFYHGASGLNFHGELSVIYASKLYLFVLAFSPWTRTKVYCSFFSVFCIVCSYFLDSLQS